MAKLLNISNHNLNQDQLLDLENMEVIDLPQELKSIWGGITPDNRLDVIKSIYNWIIMQGDPEDTKIHLAGQMDCTHVLLTALQSIGYDCVYSLTERMSEDIPQEDGSVKKVMIFKHKAWIHYLNPNSIGF